MINKFQTGGQVDQFASDMAQLFSQATRNQIQPEQIAQLEQIDQQSYQQARQMWQQGDVQGAASVLMQIIQSRQQPTQAMRKGAKLNYLRKITGNCPEGTQLTYYKVGGQICSKCEAIQQQKPMNVMASIKAEMFQGGGKATQPPKKQQQKQQPQKKPTKIIWTDQDDEQYGYYRSPSRKKPLTQEQKRDSTRLENKFKNASNKDQYEDPEGIKKGGTITTKACPKCGKVHAGKCGSKLVKKKKKCACGSQLKKIDAKKCGGKQVKIDKCGSKMKKKKHELGGILEAMQKFAKGGSLKSIPFTKTEQ